MAVCPGGRAPAYDGGPSRGGDDAGSLADRAQQYTAQRTAPGTSVSAGALLNARAQAARLPLREMGSVATHGLIDLVEQKTEAIAHTLPLESLVLRASTGRPRA